MTGLSSLIASIIIPFASYAFDGTTIFNPGTCAKRLYKHWECCAASLYPPPIAVVSTTGNLTLPPDI